MNDQRLLERGMVSMSYLSYQLALRNGAGWRSWGGFGCSRGSPRRTFYLWSVTGLRRESGYGTYAENSLSYSVFSRSGLGATSPYSAAEAFELMAAAIPAQDDQRGQTLRAHDILVCPVMRN